MLVVVVAVAFAVAVVGVTLVGTGCCTWLL